jgi:hypothetical protein
VPKAGNDSGRAHQEQYCTCQRGLSVEDEAGGYETGSVRRRTVSRIMHARYVGYSEYMLTQSTKN